MKVYDIKINGLRNPIGYSFSQVVCSWKVNDTKGKIQKNTKIEVSTNEMFTTLIYQKEDKLLSSISEILDIKLEPYTRYYVRVTVTTDAGESAVSDTCYFETAKLEELWFGKWIGMQEDAFHPVFRKVFSVDRPVKSARLYVTGLGLFETCVNGEKAGNDLLAPFINEYESGIQYCTYDITEQLIPAGENQIQLLLGNGWYKGTFGLGRRKDPKKKFGCIAEIRITYKDGSVEIVGTDESWNYQGSFLEETDIYDGEVQDYLKWDGIEKPWLQAVVQEAPYQFVERYSLPLHEMERILVKEILQTPAGETVLDLGQNFAGYLECTQQIPKGVTMTLEFGEILQNGNFYRDNYRGAKSRFIYTSDGEARVIRPYFTFFGFRYVKVSGLMSVDPECFTGRAVYSELEQIGYLETGNEKINRLISNTMWGLKSNFLDIPTDCPQRDERLGWTGDAQVFCRTAGYFMDTKAFYKKFLKDLRFDQLRNQGKVAVYLPNTFPGLTSSVWGDIATFLPSMLYEYYGDRTDLEQSYPLMKDWVDYIQAEDEKQGTHYLYDFGYHFGDWLALDGATEQSNQGRTDNTYIASAYYYASTLYVAKAAKILGYKEAQTYLELAEKIRKAILDEFYTPNGRLAIDTQTGYLIALKFGLYSDKDKIVNGLRKRLKGDCYRIKGGFVGATMMNTVMAEHELSDIAYDFLLFEGFPGWLYEVNLGATTIWERWNSVLPDGKISGTSMNSLNHYSYGAVVEFLFRNAAGMIPTAPGFCRVRLEPKPDVRLGSLKCSYDSAAGKYVSNWNIRSDGRIELHFEIPFGATAEIVLPESDKEPIRVGAGSYDYIYQPKKDYRICFREDTRLELMKDHKEAMEILKKYVPQGWNGIEAGNIEEMSKTLREMKDDALLVGMPVNSYDNAIREFEQLYC